jgi:hypothetical protein
MSDPTLSRLRSYPVSSPTQPCLISEPTLLGRNSRRVWRFLGLAVAGLAGLGPCAGAAENDAAPFRVAEGLFDLANQENLGLKTIPGEHVEVYRATEEGAYRFTHHPGLAVFQGQLYCSWSSGLGHEDRPGQRVVYSRTADGRNWTPPQVLAAPPGEQDRCIAAGLHVADDVLIAGYSVAFDYPTHNLFHDNNALFARASRDGQTWGEAVKLAGGFFIESPLRLPGGRLIRGGEHTGARWKAHELRMRMLYTDDPSGLSGWKDAVISPNDSLPRGLKVFDYTEPCPFVRPDGVIVSAFRNSSGYLYASTSRDAGASWSVPQITNFPDATSRHAAGALPDGTVFLINNPGTGKGSSPRQVLTIALSRDGIVFDRAWVIRAEPTTMRFKGKDKRDGWQYPNAAVWNGALYVAYSVNKEDLMVTRIALENLK